MKVVVVGCGHVATMHIPYIQNTASADLVALCDRDEARVRYMADRYKVNKYYTDFEVMLKKRQPDIVHILTPPQTHMNLALQAMQFGSHVLIEKPMCMTLAESNEIINNARVNQRKVCVNYTLLFDPVITKAKESVDRGDLGEIVHIECLVCDDYLERRQKGMENPWVSSMRGGIFGDLLSHPLSLLALFAPDLEFKSAQAIGKDLSEINELMLTFSASGMTATIRLSLTIRPIQQYMRIYGTRGIQHADYRHFALVTQGVTGLPNAIARFTSNVSQGLQLISSSLSAVIGFTTGRIRPMPGLPKLIENFYKSVKNDKPSPVSPEFGHRIVFLSEAVWDDVSSCMQPSTLNTPYIKLPFRKKTEVLVTGGTGFIGKYLVRKLASIGINTRVLCRQNSDRTDLPDETDFVLGDMRNPDSLEKAMQGVKLVYHLAMPKGGDWVDYISICINGNEALMKAARRAKVEKLVYLSSMGILNTANASRGTVVDESFPLESRPAERGYYTAGKLEAEKVMYAYLNGNQPAVCIIRPGIVFGSGRDPFISDAAIKIRNWAFILLGAPISKMRLIYVEDLIEALILAGKSFISGGKIYHVLDPSTPSRIEYLNVYQQLTGNRALIVPLPMWTLLTAFKVGQAGIKLLMNGSNLSLTYRLQSISADLRYTTHHINKDLGWKPKVSWKEGLRQTIETGKYKI